MPSPEGGKVRDPERSRAAATGSGETGCDDLSSEARNSRGEADPLFAIVEGEMLEVEEGGLRDDVGGLVDDAEAIDVESVFPIGIRALPSRGTGSAAVILDRFDRFEGVKTDELDVVLLSLPDAVEAEVETSGLPDSLRPNGRLGRAERPRAGASRPSGDGASGSAALVDGVDAPDPTAS